MGTALHISCVCDFTLPDRVDISTVIIQNLSQAAIYS